jgi:microcystin-dependent protein
MRGTPGSHLRRSFSPLIALQDSMVGVVMPWAGVDDNPPPGWLWCNGQNVSRFTYAKLFHRLNPWLVSIQLPGVSSPGVLNTYPLNYAVETGSYGKIYIGEGGGVLPAPLAVNTWYYVVAYTDSIRMQISATSGGAPINFTAAGSGSAFPHYFGYAPYGVSNQFTFPLPDLRSRAAAAADNMGGISGDRLTGAYAGGVNGDGLGLVGGEGTHISTLPEHPSHTHPASHTHTPVGGGQFRTNAGGTVAAATAAGTNNMTFANTAQRSADPTGAIGGIGTSEHDNAQPLLVTNYIIFSGVYP